MKSSIHPPLYLLVAVVAFFLGTQFQTQPPAAPASPVPPVLDAAPADRPEVEAGPGEPIQGAALEGQAPADPPASAESPASGSPSVIAEPASSAEPIGAAEAQAEPARSQLATRNSQPTGPVVATPFGAVEIFPADNPWNQEIGHLPVHEYSRTWIQSVGLDQPLHADFGTVWNGAPSGIPYVVVGPDQPGVPVEFEYPDESDRGPYPVPPGAPIEGGPNGTGDRHILVLDPGRKRLWELFHCFPKVGGGWKAGSGAVFDLTSNALRPDGWTSADAAGLPVFAGLVRYDEVAAGEIRHALRFTIRKSQRAFIHPATHWASRSADKSLMPMGVRVRLKASYDISRFPRSTQVILTALKKYGMLMADNGSDWFVSGAPDPRWNDDELATLKRVLGRDLECAETGPVIREVP